MPDPLKTVKQCKFILRYFLPERSFIVVLLNGHGYDEKENEDVEKVKSAINFFLNK